MDYLVSAFKALGSVGSYLSSVGTSSSSDELSSTFSYFQADINTTETYQPDLEIETDIKTPDGTIVEASILKDMETDSNYLRLYKHKNAYFFMKERAKILEEGNGHFIDRLPNIEILKQMDKFIRYEGDDLFLKKQDSEDSESYYKKKSDLYNKRLEDFKAIPMVSSHEVYFYAELEVQYENPLEDWTNSGLLKMFIARPELLNVKDKLGRTPLILSIQKGNTKAFTLIIDRARKLREANKDIQLEINNFAKPYCGNYCSTLSFAVLSKKEYIVNTLLDEGADINFVDEFGSLLHDAVIFKNLSMIKLLITRGVNINHASKKRGDTALHLAVKGALSFENECKEYVRPSSPDIEFVREGLFFWSPTPHELLEDQKKLIEVLLEAKVNREIKNKQNKTALDLAVEAKSKNLETLLLS